MDDYQILGQRSSSQKTQAARSLPQGRYVHSDTSRICWSASRTRWQCLLVLALSMLLIGAQRTPLAFAQEDDVAEPAATPSDSDSQTQGDDADAPAKTQSQEEETQKSSDASAEGTKESVSDENEQQDTKEADTKEADTKPAVNPEDLLDREVVVTQWNSEFRIPDRIVGVAEVGSIYRVSKVNGKWLWITSVGGWISAENVVPREKADSWFMAAVKKKADAMSYFDRGLYRLRNGKLDRAFQDLDRAIDMKKTAMFYNGRGIAWMEKGDIAKAIADHETALQIDPKLSSTYYSLGNAFLANKEFAKAIPNYNLAIRLNPDNGQAFINRGRCYHRIREYEDAVKDFTSAIQTNDHWPLPYNNRSDSYNRMHEYDKAIEDANKALELNPLFTWSLVNRGSAWKAKKDLQKALADYDQAIQIDPMFAPAYNNRGNARNDLGEFQSALEDYQKAIELDPQYASAYNGRAWLLVTCPDKTLRNARESLSLAQKACVLDEQEWKHFGTLAAAYAANGDFEEAVIGQERAISMLPDTASEEDRNACTKALESFKQKKTL